MKEEIEGRIEDIGTEALKFWKKEKTDTLCISNRERIFPYNKNMKIGIGVIIILLALANPLSAAVFFFLMLFANLLATNYKQLGIFKVKRPHKFKEGQKIKVILNKKGKIIDVKAERC